MKKTLLTIAAITTLSTSAQAMDAVSQAKMEDWVKTATPMLMLAQACDSPNYIKAYQTAYDIAHVAAGVQAGDVWSSIIDMEFNMAKMTVDSSVSKNVRLLKAKAKGSDRFCSKLEKDVIEFTKLTN